MFFPIGASTTTTNPVAPALGLTFVVPSPISVPGTVKASIEQASVAISTLQSSVSVSTLRPSVSASYMMNIY